MALARSLSASQAQDYYYEKDPISAPEGKGENSEWFGNMKGAFELSGRVQSDQFAALLFGLDPHNKEEIVKVGVNKERRAGIDLAFSAPKSVSIMALHGGDERIIEAHNEAVKFALGYVEENFINYRDKINGELEHIKSDNMLVGMFRHTTSRADDPQLHTHSVILNVTQAKDGRFKAISNEKIYKYQTLTNNIYQNALAVHLQKLGYSIDNHENKFEIRGVSETAIEMFSKRSREIDVHYEKLRKKYPTKTEAELMDQAVLQSRNNKNTTITADELHERWESEYSKTLLTPVMGHVKSSTEKDIVTDAIAALHKTEATFNKYQLLNSLIVQNMGDKGLNELKCEVEKAISDKTVIKIGERDKEDIYSTPEMIKIECDIVCAVKTARSAVTPILDSLNVINTHLPENLTEGQREFVEHIFTTDDRINIIQGDAGTGKTYAVKTLNDIMKKEKLNTTVIGIGFTGKAAQELADAAGIKTSTIASFLMSPKELKDSVIIVDESSMVSSRDMLSIIQKAGDNRIVFIGDGKQLQAIGAGKMFKELQKENVIKTIKMEEVLRQQTEVMKAIVGSIKSYQDGYDEDGINATIKLLESHELIIEPQSKSNRKEVNHLFLYEKAVEEYLKSDGNLLLTQSRSEKDELNNLVRKRLIEEERISTPHKTTVRESVSASGFIVGAYKVGDIVALNRKEWRIKSVDVEKNTFEILSVNKKTNKEEVKTIDPSKSEFVAYREKQKDFCKGDKILFTKNDKKMEVQNGLSGTIAELDENGNVSINVGKNRTVNFNLAAYQYLDHGYAQTIHKSQGQTADKAILVHDGKSALSTESFYVAATRAKNEFKVITLDKERFAQTIKAEQKKSSTREFVGLLK